MQIIHSKLLTEEEGWERNTLTGCQAEENPQWCKIWLSWGERQTLSFVIACTQDNLTAIIFCSISLKQVPAPLVSFQWKQRLLSHQITSHLNTHTDRISQINLIRILLPGVPPGCNQLRCIWIKLTSCCHSKVGLCCLQLVTPACIKAMHEKACSTAFRERVRLVCFRDCRVTSKSDARQLWGGSLCTLH